MGKYTGNQYGSTATVQVRFEDKIRKSAGSDCWFWIARKDDWGYGWFEVGGKTLHAHRVSYQLYVGPIPAGLQVLHRCDNPGCVNPKHLWIGTHTDNMRDKVAKGRGVDNRGENQGSSKLTGEEVLCIRSEYKEGNVSQSELGRKYGVLQQQISRIIRRERWAHLP